MSFVIGHQCYGSYIHLYRENLNEFAFKDDHLFPYPFTSYQNRCRWGCSMNTFVIHNFINSFIKSSFCSETSRHCPSLTVKAGELTFWENVHLPPCVTCHLSHVTGHVSCVMCQVPCATFFLQSGGAFCLRVCYQRGLPCLVYVQKDVLKVFSGQFDSSPVKASYLVQGLGDWSKSPGRRISFDV